VSGRARLAGRWRRARLAGVLLAALAAGTVAAGELEGALAALRAGQPGAARATLERLAAGGDPGAQEALAALLVRGIGGPRDVTGAMGWYCLLAHRPEGGRGVMQAAWTLAEYYRTGGAVPALGYRAGRREDENPLRAYFWYGVMAANGRLYRRPDTAAARLGRLGMSSVGRELFAAERSAIETALAGWSPADAPASRAACLAEPQSGP